MPVFRRVLIANRGEIAVRVARTLLDMEIAPVVVYSEADRFAAHASMGKWAYSLGTGTSAETYLDIQKILDICKSAKVDAVHPGYGFLSENAEFAAALESAGVVLIGPPAHAMRVMGSKVEARKIVEAAGVPTVPGTLPLDDIDEIERAAAKIGFPVLIKASAGGGGKGMRLVERAAELESSFRAARSEAKKAFGDATVYLEKAIIKPKHIEIQVFSGADGETVWLGARECSLQRRHQKIIEESPSVMVDDTLLEEMGTVACDAARAVDYRGAGTVEFLLDQSGQFYFLEMNTRLQVEHPVTEMCCGIDLVEAQVEVAMGKKLPWRQQDVVRRGWAMEARIYAEDASNNFMPSPGFVKYIEWPKGPGIRVDEGIVEGFEVPVLYDPMVAKIVAWGNDRDQARRRLIRALSETRIVPMTTNLGFLIELLKEKSFIDGSYHTGTVSEFVEPQKELDGQSKLAASTVAALERGKGESTVNVVHRKTSRWRRLESLWS